MLGLSALLQASATAFEVVRYASAGYLIDLGMRTLLMLPKLARLSTPLPLLEAEQAMFDDFKGRSIPLLDKQPESAWDWLALMQHHRLATRLLD